MSKKRANGEGSIRKRKDGRWEGRYTAGYDKDGKVIEEWTSTDEVHYIEKLPIGEYTLVETTAPNGYDVAESVDFKVLDTNEIQHVIMYDSPSVTPGGGTNTPKTGDINPAIPVAAGVAVVVLAGLGIFLFKGKKKKLNK